MDNTAFVALSRQLALQRDMATISTNIANMTTTGYKARHTLFETYLEDAGGPGKVAFVQDRGQLVDSRDGPLEQTGNPLDFAISGPGMFSVQTEDGVRFTRAGQFGLNADGEIVTPSGARLLDEGGGAIVLPPGSAGISLTQDGILATRDGEIARIGLVRFDDPAALAREGSNLLNAMDAQPVAVDNPRLVQGSLERSNVNGIVEMTRMIDTMRAFEGTQKLLDAHHNLERSVIEQIAATSA